MLQSRADAHPASRQAAFSPDARPGAAEPGRARAAGAERGG
jgi:hypothetical protein